MTSGTAFLPAVYSPSGERRPLLERVAFDLSITEDELQLESFCASLDDIRLRGSGSCPVHLKTQEREEAAPRGAHGDWLESTYKLIADGLAKREQFHFLKSPTLMFRLTVLDASMMELKTQVVSPLFQNDQASADEVSIALSTRIEEGAILFSEPTILRARSLQTHNYDLATGPISARITKDDWLQIMDGRWPEVELSAESLTTAGIRMDGPYLKLWHEQNQSVGFLGSAKGMLGGVEFNGVFDLHARSGWLDAGGSVSIDELLPARLTSELPRIDFSSAPYYNLYLSLNPGMKLDRLDFDCLVNDVAIEEVEFERIRARGYYSENEFILRHLDIERPEQTLEASIRYRKDTKALDALLKGIVNPKTTIPTTGLVSSVFEDFDFPGPAQSGSRFHSPRRPRTRKRQRLLRQCTARCRIQQGAN